MEENKHKKISPAGHSSTKAGGYASQKRYREKHKGDVYEPKIRIKKEYKKNLETLLSATGLSITELFVSAVEEKYNIVLHKNNANK